MVSESKSWRPLSAGLTAGFLGHFLKLFFLECSFSWAPSAVSLEPWPPAISLELTEAHSCPTNWLLSQVPLRLLEYSFIR